MVEKSLRTATLLHRKVIRLDRGKRTIMISALREPNPLLEQPIEISEAAVEDKENLDTQENRLSPARSGAATTRANATPLRAAMAQDQYLIKLVLFENKRVDVANARATPERAGGAT
jgi:hypothetical protein